MPPANVQQSNFSLGELSSKLQSRSDIDVYQRSLSACVNFVPQVQGPVKFREGSDFQGLTNGNVPAVLIPFVFRDTQAYQLEISVDGSDDINIRFWKDDGLVLYSNPDLGWVINTAAPGTTDSELIGFPTGIGNDPDFVTAGLDGDPVILNIAGTFDFSDLENIQYAQNADAIILTVKDVFTIQIWRGASSETAWAANDAKVGTAAFHSFTFEFANITDFITASDFAQAVAFYEGRLYYGHEDVLYGSKSIAEGADSYCDFTAAVTVVATDAIEFILSPIPNKVTLVKWFSASDESFYVGSESAIIRISGDTNSSPIAATSIRAKPADDQGCSFALPVVVSKDLIFVDGTRDKIRAFKFDITYDSARSFDLSLLADHIPDDVKKIVYQRGKSDVVWVLNDDNELNGMTYHSSENIFGWHRYEDNDTGVIQDISVIPASNGTDKLWMLVKRATTTGSFDYCVESSRLTTKFVKPIDYFVDEDEDEATRRWKNAIFEQQRHAVHFDSSVHADTFQDQLDNDFELHLIEIAGVITNAEVHSTGGGLQNPGPMVEDRELRIKANSSGYGEGIFKIGVVTAGNAVVSILKGIADYTAVAGTFTIPAGSWGMTANQITTTTSTLSHLYKGVGTLIPLVIDGGSSVNLEIVKSGADYTIEFGELEASVVYVGEDYVGILETHNVIMGGVTGQAHTKPKNITELGVSFINSIGVRFGNSLYNLVREEFRRGDDLANRPPPLFTGIRLINFEGSWSEEKVVYVVQSVSLPCTISAIDFIGEASDE